MGIFRTDVEIENPLRPGHRLVIKQVTVDTGAEYSWIPATVLEDLGVRRGKRLRFRQADGSVLERDMGLVTLFAAGTYTSGEVVFGQPNDLVLLGAISLEGLNVRLDIVEKRLIDAGPAPAAVAA